MIYTNLKALRKIKLIENGIIRNVTLLQDSTTGSIYYFTADRKLKLYKKNTTQTFENVLTNICQAALIILLIIFCAGILLGKFIF